MRCALVMMIAIVLGGCSDDGARAPEGGSAPRPSGEAPPRTPPPPKVDLSLDQRFAMRHPIRDGRLAIVPIVAVAEAPASAYITLDEGLARHVVSVRELPSWEVATVRIRNRSSQPLFVMAGELILDARQDRVIAEDRVILAGDTANVQVRCVEKGREEGGRDFHAGNLLGELALRRAVVHQSQPDVWMQVDAINRRLHLSPPTATYRQAAQLQLVAPASQRRDRILQALAGSADRDRQIGVAVAIDGEVVAVERFASPELYRALEGKLIGSYVASDDGIPHEGKTLMPDDVRALVATRHAVTTASDIALRQQP